MFKCIENSLKVFFSRLSISFQNDDAIEMESEEESTLNIINPKNLGNRLKTIQMLTKMI